MGRITDEGRRKRGRGTGIGAEYDPWIHVGQKEFRNNGTSTRLTDYKTGRRVHLASRGELGWWYELRWRDDVAEIYEQCRLFLEDTTRIAESLGFRHPTEKGELKTMTTDMLVIFTDGSACAYSIKSGRSSLDSPRTVEKQAIERAYWKERGVEFKMAFKEDLNQIRTDNLIDITDMYDAEYVCDDVGILRHLIARKLIIVDLDSEPLDYAALKREYRKEIELWKRENSNLLAVFL